MAYPEIAGYTIERELGRGGMGVVYLALDTKLHRQVALKFLKTSELADLTEAQLQHESRLLAQLEHPGIVPIYGQGRLGDDYYLVMRYLSGGTLIPCIRPSGLPLAEVQALLIPLLEALHHAHQAGVIHRDLKPANILRDKDGRPQLVDFGIAKLLNSDPTRPTQGGIKGTPAYMSPEQIEGKKLDGRSDLYSLGVVAYELLTGTRPFTTEDQSANPMAMLLKHLMAPVPRLPEALAVMQPFLDKLLAKTPQDRYPDAATALAALRALNSPAPLPETEALTQEQQRRAAAEARLCALEAETVQAKANPQAESPVPKARAQAVLRGPSALWWTVGVAGMLLLSFGYYLGQPQSTPVVREEPAAQEAVTAMQPEPTPQPQVQLAKPAMQTWTDRVTGLEFSLIPAGCFQMGSPDGEEGRSDDEGPQHRVCMSEPFYMSRTEVTQQAWEAVMGSNPSEFKGANRPVEGVSWDDIQTFLRKLTARGKSEYRLPSEAEWEYAVRAGTTTAYHWGANGNLAGRYAWYEETSGRETHPVGAKQPNAWGLYDTSGNVWEWVQDCWHGSYEGAPSDGSAWVSSGGCDSRVFRGGSWDYHPRGLRAAERAGSILIFRSGGLGFRLVLPSR